MFCVTYFCFVACGCAYLWNSHCSHARTKSVQRYKNFLTYASKNNKISLSHFFFHLHPALSLLSPPTLFLSLSSLTLPIIHSKIAVCFDTFPTHTRYIPDTYPIHTYIPWIPHEYLMNTPWIPHKAEKRERKRRKSASFQPASRIFPCIFQKKIVPLRV